MPEKHLSFDKKKRPPRVVQAPAECIRELLSDDGTFPNNEQLPLLMYREAFDLTRSDAAGDVENVFHANQWRGSWRNGIYGFQHYHSTAHEVLGIYSGTVQVQLGGPGGITLTAEKGDVIIIPAGVAHKNLGSRNFRCVGAYPRGQSWDMNYGKTTERPQADRNIARVPLPEFDPVYGSDGPLIDDWLQK
ncbi:MAG TPA: cupin domain-containing protein [bacterium]|nr:cupin domain-containing protein [bacterium]